MLLGHCQPGECVALAECRGHGHQVGGCGGIPGVVPAEVVRRIRGYAFIRCQVGGIRLDDHCGHIAGVWIKVQRLGEWITIPISSEWNGADTQCRSHGAHLCLGDNGIPCGPGGVYAHSQAIECANLGEEAAHEVCFDAGGSDHTARGIGDTLVYCVPSADVCVRQNDGEGEQTIESGPSSRARVPLVALGALGCECKYLLSHLLPIRRCCSVPEE